MKKPSRLMGEGGGPLSRQHPTQQVRLSLGDSSDAVSSTQQRESVTAS